MKLFPNTHSHTRNFTPMNTKQLTTHTMKNPSNRKTSRILAGSIVALLAVQAAQSATYVWDAGGGATTTWSDGTNWTPDGAPVFAAGDVFDLSTLDITAASTSTVDANATLGIINIGDTNGTHSWRLDSTGGAVLTLDNSTAGAQINQTATSFGDTISVTLALADALNITNSSTAALTISSGITAVSGTRAISNLGTGGTLLSGVIGDGGGTVSVVQNNALGKLTLTIGNSYTGATTVTAGVLNIQNATATGTTAGGVTVAGGAALELEHGSGFTVGAETLALNGSGIGGNGALRNISGTNVWQGAVTLNGATTIRSDAGTLTFNTAATSIAGTNTNLTIEGAGNVTISGTTAGLAIGSGTLTKNGGGTLTLSSANTYTGGTVVNFGTLSTSNGNLY